MKELRWAVAVVVLGLFVSLGASAARGQWVVALIVGWALLAAGRLSFVLASVVDEDGDDDGGTERGDQDAEDIAWARGWGSSRAKVKDLERN